MSKDLQILQLTADGKSQRMIAKMLSVSRNRIFKVQKRTQYKAGFFNVNC